MVGASNASVQNRARQIYPAVQDLAERAYYALPTTMAQRFGSNTPDQLSTSRAASRGAKYAQENRINQIRQSRGLENFDPIADRPGPISAGNQAQYDNIARLASGQNMNNSQGQPLSHVLARQNDPNEVGPLLRSAVGGMQGDINTEMANIEPYLRSRYTADATNAGTLSGTGESQRSLQTDIAAGEVGARSALQDQSQLLTNALGGSFNQPAQTPQVDTSNPLAGQMAPQTIGLPEDAPAGAQVISGASNTGIRRTSRTNAIQAKRAKV